jgi:hypothetical protein
VDLSLTDRGLVDLDFLWICGAALSLTLGFAIGRWWALAVPIALTGLIFLGVDRDWWGGGLAEGWEAGFAWSTTVGLALAGLGMVASLGMRRLRWPRPDAQARRRRRVCRRPRGLLVREDPSA